MGPRCVGWFGLEVIVSNSFQYNVRENSMLNYENPEPFLNALADIFAFRGSAKEVAVVAESQGLVEYVGSDDYNGQNYYQLILMVARPVYSRIYDELEALTKAIEKVALVTFKGNGGDQLTSVKIFPQNSDVDPSWREKALAMAAGEGLNNQGRVRSDNIASKTADGLLFRSQPEVFLYQALKAEGIAFAPLPVFIRGGSTYRRIEPDFILVKDGIVLQVEIDGDTVHKETPAEAHERTAILHREGVHLERFSASLCATEIQAKALAKKLIEIIEKQKNNRR